MTARRPSFYAANTTDTTGPGRRRRPRRHARVQASRLVRASHRRGRRRALRPEAGRVDRRHQHGAVPGRLPRALSRQVVRRHEPFRRFPVRRTRFPDVLDHYMTQNEFQGDGAKAASEADAEETEAASIDAPSVLAATLRRWTQFCELAPYRYEDARQRVLYPLASRYV